MPDFSPWSPSSPKARAAADLIALANLMGNSMGTKRVFSSEGSDEDGPQKKAKAKREDQWKQIMKDRFTFSPFGFAF